MRAASSGRSRTSSCSRCCRCACRRPPSCSRRGAAGIAGAVELARGQLVAAALLIQLKTVLDNADGQLARLSGQVTLLGRYLDSLCDLLVDAALFAGLGVVRARTGRAARRVRRADAVLSVELQPRAALPRRRDLRPGGARPRARAPARVRASCTAGRTRSPTASSSGGSAVHPTSAAPRITTG